MSRWHSTIISLGCWVLYTSVAALSVDSTIYASIRQETATLPEPTQLPDLTGEEDAEELKNEAAKVVPRLLGEDWERFTPYPLPVSEAQGAVLEYNGRKFLFITGGYLYGTNFDVTNHTYTYEMFDGEPDTQWVRRADMPMRLTHVAQVAVGAKLYTCGGYLGKHPGPSVKNCFVYNFESDGWKELPGLPERRAGGGMVYIKAMKSLLFAGGALREAGEEEGNDFEDSFALKVTDMESGWEWKAKFVNPRNHMSGIEVDGRYFFVGGQHGANEESGNQKSLDEYVANEDRWYERKGMTYGIGHLSASTPRWGGGFLVIGGVQDGRAKSDDILFYDMLNNSWVEVGKYARSVQTPVCGVTENTIFCSSGAGDVGVWEDSYMRRIGHDIL